MSATTDIEPRTGRYLFVFLAASLWGLIGVFSRKFGDEGIAPIEIAFWPVALSGVLFGVTLFYDGSSLRSRQSFAPLLSCVRRSLGRT